MRKSASEVIRNLEMRIARLEKQSWVAHDTPGDYYLDNIQEKAVQAILSSFGGVWSGEYGTSSERKNSRVYFLGPKDFDSMDTKVEVKLEINLFEGDPILMPLRHGSVRTHADTPEKRKDLERNLSKLKRLMGGLGYTFQGSSFPKSIKLDRRTNRVEKWEWPQGATHFFEDRVSRVRFTIDVGPLMSTDGF